MEEFLAMDGYARFVWGSFGCWVVCIVYNMISARRKIEAAQKQAEIAAARHRHRRSRETT